MWSKPPAGYLSIHFIYINPSNTPRRRRETSDKACFSSALPWNFPGKLSSLMRRSKAAAFHSGDALPRSTACHLDHSWRLQSSNQTWFRVCFLQGRSEEFTGQVFTLAVLPQARLRAAFHSNHLMSVLFAVFWKWMKCVRSSSQQELKKWKPTPFVCPETWFDFICFSSFSTLIPPQQAGCQVLCIISVDCKYISYQHNIAQQLTANSGCENAEKKKKMFPFCMPEYFCLLSCRRALPELVDWDLAETWQPSPWASASCSLKLGIKVKTSRCHDFSCFVPWDHNAHSYSAAFCQASSEPPPAHHTVFMPAFIYLFSPKNVSSYTTICHEEFSTPDPKSQLSHLSLSKHKAA